MFENNPLQLQLNNSKCNWNNDWNINWNYTGTYVPEIKAYRVFRGTEASTVW